MADVAPTTPQIRKIRNCELTIGGQSFEFQLNEWKVVNNTGDPERNYTCCPAGELLDDQDPEYTLEGTFFADWRAGGISDYLTQNDGTEVAFQLDHNPDIAAEHVRWAGTVKLRAPDAGGTARENEKTEAKMMIIGEPTYSRPEESAS